MESLGAKIVTPEEFAKIRPALGRVVAVSGGFDPVHPGHLSYLIESKKYGDVLAVIVNGDWFLTAKKGKPFQDLKTRSQIISAIRGVDYVVPFEIEGDMSVCKALEIMRPDVFTNGGDRKEKDSIAEWEICQKNNIKLVTGVGLDKKWSSSWFLKDWHEFLSRKNDA